jgi:hypothetical protein
MSVVIAGSKYDRPDPIRLKLHEEYGRVWLYVANADGTSKQDGRILCIDDDGYLRIAAKHRTNENGDIYIEMPPSNGVITDESC